MKKKTFSACIMAALLTAGIASTQAAAGILAEGNISVYKGGNLSGTITGQNPVDEEALLVCNDKCMIKTTGISIVGATGTEMAVKNDQKQFNLLLKQGQLDFILSGAVGKMGFYTPDGQYTVADIVYNVSTNTPVRGYMHVTEEGKTAIGVYEGRMIFSTVEGAKIVDSNNYILLAQADVGAGGGGAGGGGAGAAGAGAAGAGAAGAGAAGAGAAGAVGSAAAALGVGTTTFVVGGVIAAGVVVAGGVAAVDAIDEANQDDDPAPGHVETTPPSQTPAGTAPNNRASEKATPPAAPRNPSANM